MAPPRTPPASTSGPDAIKRVSNGKWLRPTGKYGRKAWLPARVVDRGAKSTVCPLPRFRPPARGKYVVELRVQDQADNRTKAGLRFKVVRR